ncbi:Fic family protein, partial [bacterium]|nr:Fic family protein [bacterium]
MDKNNKFYKRLIIEDPLDSQKIQNTIAEIEKLSGMWTAGVKLAPQILNVLKRSTIITSTGSSTRIEGSKLTDKEIERLFSTGLKVKKFSTRDEQEVAGYKELLENIFNSYEAIKFNESAIKHFHKELLKYSDKDQKHLGEYKFGDNSVVATDKDGAVIGLIFEPTKPHLTAKEMQELLAWTEEAFRERIFHPLLVIASFIMEFLAIHPFQDGNGRTSRVLTNFLMLKYGYDYMPYISHEKLIEDNKDRYY